MNLWVTQRAGNFLTRSATVVSKRTTLVKAVTQHEVALKNDQTPWEGEDLEVRCCGLFQDTIPATARHYRGKARKTHPIIWSRLNMCSLQHVSQLRTTLRAAQQSRVQQTSLNNLKNKQTLQT